MRRTAARAVALVGLTAALFAIPTAARATTLVDAVLAAVDGEIVTASDVALARALGFFGFTPSPAPIETDDVERAIRVVLVLAEARRLAIDAPADAVGAAWRETETRAGGPAALDAWLTTAGVAREWAWRAVEAHVRWRRFIELRFVALAFVTPDEVTAALGAGVADADARTRAYERLRDVKAEGALAAWLDERAATAAIRRGLAPGGAVSVPFVGPGRQPTRPSSSPRGPGAPSAAGSQTVTVVP